MIYICNKVTGLNYKWIAGSSKSRALVCLFRQGELAQDVHLHSSSSLDVSSAKKAPQGGGMQTASSIIFDVVAAYLAAIPEARDEDDVDRKYIIPDAKDADQSARIYTHTGEVAPRVL